MKFPRIEKMNLSDLRPADYNPRAITDKALTGLGESIDRFGLVQPLVWNKRTGNLVGGHQRLKVLLDRKQKSVDVVVVNISPIEEKALNVTLNNPEIAGTFTDELQEVLRELHEHDDMWMESLRLDALLTVDLTGLDDPAEEKERDREDDKLPDVPRKSFKAKEEKAVGKHKIVCGDCVESLRKLPADSVDAIVTDPPYGIGFMGEDWDCSVPGLEWARECIRVLKPGGHIIAFAATRTVHRLAVAIEDAGFEIRDTISWLYWQGFPKNHDISKAIDDAAGAKRKVIGKKTSGIANATEKNRHTIGAGKSVEVDVTEPATEEAKAWSGWGTALKPAQEPAILARKPMAGTIADNVLRHGTGAINIDGCRYAPGDPAWAGPQDSDIFSGRWPANIYACPKPAKSEKDAGVEEASMASSAAGPGGWDDRAMKNHHPTVKPVRLMRWLVRLVTPPGGLVVDTFLGSGTTMVAAEREGVRCIGFERSGEFAALSAARVEHAIKGE